MKSPDCRARRILFAIFLSIVMLILSTDLLVASPDSPAVATMIFLRISPSTQANAMGHTYGNTFHNSPMASIYHPASLGFFARENQFGSSIYTKKIDWLPGFGLADLWYDASSFAFGINLRDHTDIPVSVGLGFHEVFLNLGETEVRDENGNLNGDTYTTWERSEGTTIAVAFDYFVRVSIGHTWKNAESHLVDPGPGSSMRGAFAETDATDYGFIVEVPLVSLLENFDSNLKEPLPNTEFYFDPGFFYSKSNIGGKVSYIDRYQADPIPRTVSIGINLKTGLSYLTESDEIKLLGFNWSRELDEMLVKKNRSDGSTAYKRGLQDIKFFENMILGKANENIDAFKQGFEVNFADCFFLRHGRYEDIEGRVRFTSKGWGMDYMQLVKIPLKMFFHEENKFMLLLKNLNIEQHHAEYEIEAGHPLEGTEFNSYVIRFRLN